MVQCLLLLRTPPPNSGHQGAGEAPALAPPAKLAWSTSLSTFRPAPPGPGVPQCQCLRLKLRNVASVSAFTLGGRVPGLAASLLSASPPADDRLLPVCPAQWGTQEQVSCGQGSVYIRVCVYVRLWGTYACLCMSMSVCLCVRIPVSVCVCMSVSMGVCAHTHLHVSSGLYFRFCCSYPKQC